MIIDYEKLADIISDKINKRKTDCDCIYNISPEDHGSHHRLIASLATMLGKIDNIKWDVIRQLVKVVMWAVIAVFLLGLSVKFGAIKL